MTLAIPPVQVRMPDTATAAVLVADLLSGDGPFEDYASVWFANGGGWGMLAFATVESWRRAQAGTDCPEAPGSQ